jgi:hypothetical protein
MEDDYRNRHDWFTLTAALVLWTAHFGLLWAASSIFPGQTLARWLALVLTVASYSVLGWIWLRAKRPSLASVAGFGVLLAAVGMGLDALPALVG